MAEEQTQVGAAGRVRNVAPTIIIGLGGTGKEVLLRLRRRFYEKYNDFSFPTIGHLWIDTDTRNIDIDDQPLDHIMQQVMFHDDERVNAEVQSDAFKGYFGDQRVYPHVFSWLDRKLSAQGQVVNGAGRVRPLGRLAFFHRYGDIRGKLGKLLAKVQAQSAIDEMRDRYGITVDSTLLDVVMIFSIAGGTGSGMFLDTAFMCREALPNPNITGYLMLPSVFSDDIRGSEKIFANSYAALKELEFYSLRKDLLAKHGDTDVSRLGENSRHDFVADWENRQRNSGIKPRPILPPPFNTCYIIDNMTQGGGRIGPKDKKFLCDMVAENIFLNFSSEEFSRRKDSVRSNLEEWLGHPLFYRYEEHGSEGGYTEILAQRYSAFGLSKLYVPVDRIRRACGYQLSLDLIGGWLKRNELDPINIERRLEANELRELGLRAGVDDDIAGELRRVGERTFADDIKEHVDAWRDELLRIANTEKQPNLYEEIPRRLKAFVKRYFDKSDSREDRWGEYIKTLEQNRRRLEHKVCGEFKMDGTRVSDGTALTCVRRWLADENVRIYLTIEYLKVLGRILDRHVDEFYVAEQERAEQRVKSTLEEIKLKLDVIRDEETGFIVKRKSLRALIDHTCRHIREHLEARAESLVCAAAIEDIRGRIKPYVGKEELREDERGQQVADRAGLVLELWTLRDELTALYHRFAERLAAFETVEEHLIYENLYKEGMFREYYKIQRPEGQYPVPAKLEEMEGLLFKRLGCVNPHDFRAMIRERGVETVLTDIEEFCYTQFRELEVNADALEIFMKQYTSPDARTTRLQRLVKNGSVWLSKSRQAGTLLQLTQNRHDSVLISQSAAGRERYRALYDQIVSLVKSGEYSDFQYPTSSRADSVFLYTEYAGIPLAYIRNVERYYDEGYLPLAQQGMQLHIDYHEEKFADILIKPLEEIERTLRANRALLIGTMLRAVKTSADGNGNVSFSFTSVRDGMSQNKPLGTEQVAIETLKRNPQLMDSIETEINKRRMTLTPEARLKFYTILYYHVIDGENPWGFPAGPFARDHQVRGGAMNSFFSPETKVIEETLSEEYAHLEQLMNGNEPVVEGFKRYYQKRDDFSDDVLVNERHLRVLKNGAEG